MAFVPRALKVHESRPPVKKAKRTPLRHHVEPAVCRREEGTDAYPSHSESTSVGHIGSLSIATGSITATAAGEPIATHDQDITDSGRTSPTARLGRPVGDGGNVALEGDSDEDEPVVSYSKDQRWPLPGEPVCVVCGRYGAYISDATEDDVCSLECKARAMHLKGLPLVLPATAVQQQQQSGRGEGSEGTGALVGVDPQTVEWNYREHPDVASLSAEQVEALRTEMRIKVKGGNVPKPVLRFRHCIQQEKVLSNLSGHLGITTPTPVQMQVLPAILKDRDVLVSASTGSGKTLCFLLPLVERLSYLQSSRPVALVLGPVRELCIQTETVAKQLMRGLPNLRTALLVGGLPLSNQLHRLRQQVQLVVATPARLIDILSNHGGAVDLSGVQYLVLDEVDSLLQMGFEQQVRQILEYLPVRRVTMMFSATIPPRVEEMGSELLTDPVYVAVGEPSLPAEGIRHIVLWEAEDTKKKRLFTILNDRKLFSPPTVVFVTSRAATLLLADSINKSCNVAAMALHGEMPQERRSAILTDFQSGKYSLLVATGGLVGRGLDLPLCRQVLVFDFPSSIHEYIHQVGRCARLGSQGTAITFINESSKGHFLRVVEVLQPTGAVVPPELLQSRHLQLQRERRALKQAEGSVAGEDKDVNLHDQSSLMDLIKGKRKRRK